MIKGKKGGMTDLFIFMILAVAIVFICAIFIYMGNISTNAIHETLDGKDYMAGGQNVSLIIDDTFGAVDRSYQALYWISWFLIVGMVISIFIGSYLVTTKPIFFIPYAFITIIAVIVSTGISNAYEMVINDPTMASTFAGFVGANFIMLKLPIWIAVIGIVGGIIMFVKMGSKENEIYGGSGGIYG
jgi:uncharacterized membrane protein (DUF106 family)